MFQTLWATGQEKQKMQGSLFPWHSLYKKQSLTILYHSEHNDLARTHYFLYKNAKLNTEFVWPINIQQNMSVQYQLLRHNFFPHFVENVHWKLVLLVSAATLSCLFFFKKFIRGREFWTRHLVNVSIMLSWNHLSLLSHPWPYPSQSTPPSLPPPPSAPNKTTML